MSERKKITHITKVYGGKFEDIVGYVSYKAEGQRISSNRPVYLDETGLHFRIGKERYYLKEIRKQIPKERGGLL